MSITGRRSVLLISRVRSFPAAMKAVARASASIAVEASTVALITSVCTDVRP